MTDRACLPEPPCDCRTATTSPDFASQALAKLALRSWYNSRVGS